MKVWINYRDNNYSGGMMLVAAHSAEEAHEVFHSNETLGWMWEEDEYAGYIYDSYYNSNTWELMPMLEANVDKPQVLAEAGYSE